jgi:hypothetical protein
MGRCRLLGGGVTVLHGPLTQKRCEDVCWQVADCTALQLLHPGSTLQVVRQ